MIIDTRRPTTDITVTNYTVTGASTAWEALSDDSDSSFIDPGGTTPPNPVAALGFGGTSIPAGHLRHQLRMSLRGYSNFGAGHRANAVLFFGIHQWTQTFTWNNLTPETRIGTWRTCPPELVSAPSPAQVAGDVRAVMDIGGSPFQIDVTEAYIDIDYRAAPDFTPNIANATTFTDTNVLPVFFESVNLDGLPARTWSLELTGPVEWEADGVGMPPTSATLFMPPLPNGSYTLTYTLSSTVAANTPFPTTMVRTFDVAVAPPDPPDVTVTDNEDGTVDVCWVPPGLSLQVFTESGTWDWEAAGSPATVNVLMIGGGGAGGLTAGLGRGGGGGGGGYRLLAGYPVSGDCTVVVGQGAPDITVINGGDSSFDGQSVPGGGTGGFRTGGFDGVAGGSGGGGGVDNGNTGNGGAGSSYGNSGGNAAAGNGTTRAAGGGGGAGGPGGNATPSNPGPGGVGVDLSHIVGTLYGDDGWFAGGGGGFSNAGGAAGGKGGGGNAGQNAMPGTGGGGGSSSAGADGIVIVYEGTPVGDGPVMAEIFRTDCQGTRRVHVQDATISCWTDCTAPHSIDDVCGTDGQPCAITYEVRFWACVGGFVLVSDPTITDPVTIENPMPGWDWLTTTIDGECVKVALCGTGGWQRGRPLTAYQPAEGGLPTVITGAPGGRNYSLDLATTTISDLHLLEKVLAQPLVWYQPAFDHGTWLAPNNESYMPRVRRAHSQSVSFVATGPEPVAEPLLDCDAIPPDSPGEEV